MCPLRSRNRIKSVLLPVCTVVTAVKARYKCFGTFFGRDSKSHSRFSFFKCMSELWNPNPNGR